MMSQQVDVAFLVALGEEFAPFQAMIMGPGYRVHQDPETGTYFYLFEKRTSEQVVTCVATFAGKMGEKKARAATERLLRKWNPRTVVLLGIAAGIGSDVRIGDVVVARFVESYLEDAKVYDTGDKDFAIQPAGDPFKPTDSLVNVVEHFRFAHATEFGHWEANAAKMLLENVGAAAVKKLTKAGVIRENPQIVPGGIACGPVVSASKTFNSWLTKTKNRKYIALEMESAGVLAAIAEIRPACQCLILKGVSDFGDQRKGQMEDESKNWFRTYAMLNSYSLVWSLLSLGHTQRQLCHPQATPPHPESQKPDGKEPLGALVEGQRLDIMLETAKQVLALRGPGRPAHDVVRTYLTHFGEYCREFVHPGVAWVDIMVPYPGELAARHQLPTLLPDSASKVTTWLKFKFSEKRRSELPPLIPTEVNGKLWLGSGQAFHTDGICYVDRMLDRLDFSSYDLTESEQQSLADQYSRWEGSHNFFALLAIAIPRQNDSEGSCGVLNLNFTVPRPFGRRYVLSIEQERVIIKLLQPHISLLSDLLFRCSSPREYGATAAVTS